jgi:hypothetical protein
VTRGHTPAGGSPSLPRCAAAGQVAACTRPDELQYWPISTMRPTRFGPSSLNGASHPRFARLRCNPLHAVSRNGEAGASCESSGMPM